MCEASPPSHPPRGPCGTLAEAERVVAAARISALRASLGTDDGGVSADGSSPLSSLSPLTSSAPPLLVRVHPAVRLFVGGVTSARCLRTLRANGVTHVLNVTTCLPHFHEGRPLVETEGEGEKEGRKKNAAAAATKEAKAATASASAATCSPSSSSSFSYLRVPIYDDASQDLGPHLDSALAFIDAGLSFSSAKGGESRRQRRRRRQEEEEEERSDDDDDDDDKFEQDFFDFDSSSPPSPSPSPTPSPSSGGGGGGVLIHCVGGFSRSAALAAAWLVSRAGATAEGAVAAVKRARPLAAPNSGFVEQLRGYEARVAAARASMHHGGGGGRLGRRRESDREFSRRLHRS